MRRLRGPGLYVAVEGIDGAGTTTHSRLAVRVLRRLGYCAYWVKEPGSKLLEKTIRLLLSEGGRPETLALLFAADRVEVESLVEEYAGRGCIVVSDRSVVSSIAYQALYSGLGVGWVTCINRYALLPDLVVYLDVDPGIALARVWGRGGGRDLFEKASVLREVYRFYEEALALVEEMGSIVARVEATPGGVELPVERVAGRVVAAILAAIYSRRSLATKPPPQRDTWG